MTRVSRTDRLIDSPPDSIENGDPVKIAQPKQQQGGADAKQ